MKLECYRCKSPYQLLIEEKVNNDTGEIIEKNFVCLRCSGQITEKGKKCQIDDLK